MDGNILETHYGCQKYTISAFLIFFFLASISILWLVEFPLSVFFLSYEIIIGIVVILVIRGYSFQIVLPNFRIKQRILLLQNRLQFWKRTPDQKYRKKQLCIIDSIPCSARAFLQRWQALTLEDRRHKVVYITEFYNNIIDFAFYVI